MNSHDASGPSQETVPALPAGGNGPNPDAAPGLTPVPVASARRPVLMPLLAVLALTALVTSLLLWQKLSNIQEQLARQTADSGAQALEARASARGGVRGAFERDCAAAQPVAGPDAKPVALAR